MSNSATALVQSLLAVAAALAFIWKLYQLKRARYDMTLRAVTFALFFYAVAGVLVVHAVADPINALIGSRTQNLVRNIFISSAHFWMVRFVLLSTTGRLAPLRRRVAVELTPYSVTVLTLGLSTAFQPAHLPQTLLSRQALASPPVAVFYGVGNLYIAYTFTLVTTAVWVAARSAHPVLRRGLQVTAAAAATVGVFSLLRIALVCILASGVDISPATLAYLSAPLTYGLVFFFLGLTYPGTVQRLRSANLWWRRRRAFSRMGPLWQLLQQEFPAIVLRRVPVIERAGFRRVHANYYRRYIEIRDALVPLSSFVPGTDINPADGSRRVEILLAALRARANGDLPSTEGGHLFPATSDELDVDARSLARLSDSVRRSA